MDPPVFDSPDQGVVATAAGPEQFRRFELGCDQPSPCLASFLGAGVVERRRLALRVVVEDVPVGQVPRQPGTRHEGPPDPVEDIRFFVGYPREFRAHRLVREPRAASCGDHNVRAESGLVSLSTCSVDLMFTPWRMPGRSGVPASAGTRTRVAVAIGRHSCVPCSESDLHRDLIACSSRRGAGQRVCLAVHGDRRDVYRAAADGEHTGCSLIVRVLRPASPCRSR